MRTLHSSHKQFLLAGLLPDGSPKIFYNGPAYCHAQSGSDSVVFSGRIDEIRGQSSHRDTHSTASLLLAHLRKTSSFEDVQGQFFAVAVINNELIAHRSQFCGTSLFYGDRHVSDNIFQICKLEKHSQISKAYLFNFVLDLPAWQFDGQLSPIEGISRLQSNATLRRRQSLFSVQRHTQEPLTHHYNPKQSHADAGRIILSHLRQTISDDLNFIGDRNIFCELSGGLDSSFTSALVAEASRSAKAYAYSYPDQPSHQQSIGYAKTVAEKFSIPLEIVNGNDIPIPSISDDLPISNEPADFFWQGALFGPVIRNICGNNSVVFTGFGADQILNRVNTVAVNLLRQKSFSHFFSTVRDMATDADRSTTNFIWQAFLGTLPRTVMLRLMGFKFSSSYRPFIPEELGDSLRHFQPIPWLKIGKSFRSRCEVNKNFEQADEIHRRYFKDCLANPNLYYLSAPDVVWGGELGEGNIWQMHPFCDRRLISASFKDISWHLIHDWKSLYKQTLREAQSGIMPEDLRLRKRDDFSFDGFFLRFLRKNRGPLYQMALETSKLLDGHFDAEQFETTFEQNIFGVQTIETQKLNRFLAAAVWNHGFRTTLERLPCVDSFPELA